MNYTLLDTSTDNRRPRHIPRSPSPEELGSLLPPALVKLGFIARNQRVEYRWVQISRMERRQGQQWLRGKLNNDPQVFAPCELKDGDMVEFQSHHVLAIYDKDEYDAYAKAQAGLA